MRWSLGRQPSSTRLASAIFPPGERSAILPARWNARHAKQRRKSRVVLPSATQVHAFGVDLTHSDLYGKDMGLQPIAFVSRLCRAHHVPSTGGRQLRAAARTPGHRRRHRRGVRRDWWPQVCSSAAPHWLEGRRNASGEGHAAKIPQTQHTPFAAPGRSLRRSLDSENGCVTTCSGSAADLDTALGRLKLAPRPSA